MRSIEQQNVFSNLFFFITISHHIIMFHALHPLFFTLVCFVFSGPSRTFRFFSRRDRIRGTYVVYVFVLSGGNSECIDILIDSRKTQQQQQRNGSTFVLINVLFVCILFLLFDTHTHTQTNRYYQLLWRHRAGDDEVGHDRHDLSTIWIGLLVWSILPHRFAINAGYTNHRRLFEDTNGGRFFCKLWGRKCSTSACLREIIIDGIDYYYQQLLQLSTAQYSSTKAFIHYEMIFYSSLF